MHTKILRTNVLKSNVFQTVGYNPLVGLKKVNLAGHQLAFFRK